MDILKGIGILEGTVLVGLLALSILPAMRASILAGRKGLPPIMWALLGLALSSPIVVALLVFPGAQNRQRP
jgi:hypothetical protein